MEGGGQASLRRLTWLLRFLHCSGHVTTIHQFQSEGGAETMKIACLGWGSLVWDPRDLPTEGRWSGDGPKAPVEFARQSADGRITLVIEPTAAPVQLCWVVLNIGDFDRAKEALRDREGITGANWDSRIGQWRRGEATPEVMPGLPAWAEARGLDAVIWTALAPRFGGRDVPPSANQLIEYLRSLTGNERASAERYVRCAPAQIGTKFRREIEAALGWNYQECSSA